MPFVKHDNGTDAHTEWIPETIIYYGEVNLENPNPEIYNHREVVWLRTYATDSQLGSILKQRDSLIEDRRHLIDQLRAAHNIISGYRLRPSHVPKGELDIQVVDAWLKRNDWAMR